MRLVLRALAFAGGFALCCTAYGQSAYLLNPLNDPPCELVHGARTTDEAIKILVSTFGNGAKVLRPTKAAADGSFRFALIDIPRPSGGNQIFTVVDGGLERCKALVEITKREIGKTAQ